MRDVAGSTHTFLALEVQLVGFNTLPLKVELHATMLEP